jgi:hypothetical protein
MSILAARLRNSAPRCSDQNVAAGDSGADVGEVSGRIEWQRAIKPRHVGEAAVQEQQRGAVGRRFSHRVHADDAAGAAAILDHDGLAEAR